MWVTMDNVKEVLSKVEVNLSVLRDEAFGLSLDGQRNRQDMCEAK